MSLSDKQRPTANWPQQTAPLPGSPENARRVEADARSRLLQSNYPQLQQVRSDFHNGVLTLHGRVSSYYLKQVVQSLVLGMEGVVEIRNWVEVT